MLLLLALVLALAAGIQGLTKTEQAEIAGNHNTYRAGVNPTASDMLNMTWYDPAGKTAQSWASKCKRLQHDPAASRKDKTYGGCGQNIFISSAKTTWATAVKAWYSEVAKFTYGSDANVFMEIGHYTQVVWASTHKVGCGYAKCKDAKGTFHNYVCNYCPAGNMAGKINTPYTKGEPCSTCPSTCLANKLCPAPAPAKSG